MFDVVLLVLLEFSFPVTSSFGKRTNDFQVVNFPLDETVWEVLHNNMILIMMKNFNTAVVILLSSLRKANSQPVQ